jgi:hypothetical protein
VASISSCMNQFDNCFAVALKTFGPMKENIARFCMAEVVLGMEVCLSLCTFFALYDLFELTLCPALPFDAAGIAFLGLRLSRPQATERSVACECS